jgi:AraC-like DNA-binding protein
MTHRYHNLNPQLTEFIRTVLVFESVSKAATNKFPVFTNGMQALVCKTEKDKKGNEHISLLSLYGTSIPAEIWNLKKNTTIISYFFKPFTLTTLFNVEAGKIVNSPIELAMWNAHKCNALKTQLFYAETTEQKIQALDNLLLKQLNENKNVYEIIQFATDKMMDDPGANILLSLQKELKINERTFQRMFKKYVGLSPNQYRRICQFQLSFTQLRSQKFENLGDVAFDNGFADQSHFNRAFKEFTEITPHKYLKSGLKNK